VSDRVRGEGGVKCGGYVSVGWRTGIGYYGELRRGGLDVCGGDQGPHCPPGGKWGHESLS